MPKTFGDNACQAAVFVYKNDKTKDLAWSDALEISEEAGDIRAERHEEKGLFLAALKRWNKRVEPSNAFLCIYAHMGKPGLNAIPGQASTRVTWNELASALPNGVAYLWLVGCRSQLAITAGTPLISVVHHRLLVTSKSKPWRPLLECFRHEISMDSIAFDDEMPQRIREDVPALADAVFYYHRVFRQVFEKV